MLVDGRAHLGTLERIALSGGPGRNQRVVDGADVDAGRCLVDGCPARILVVDEQFGWESVVAVCAQCVCACLLPAQRPEFARGRVVLSTVCNDVVPQLWHSIVVDDVDLVCGRPQHGHNVVVAVPQLDVAGGRCHEISTTPPIEVASQCHGQRPLLGGHPRHECEHGREITGRGNECVCVGHAGVLGHTVLRCAPSFLDLPEHGACFTGNFAHAFGHLIVAFGGVFLGDFVEAFDDGARDIADVFTDVLGWVFAGNQRVASAVFGAERGLFDLHGQLRNLEEAFCGLEITGAFGHDALTIDQDVEDVVEVVDVSAQGFAHVFCSKDRVEDFTSTAVGDFEIGL